MLLAASPAINFYARAPPRTGARPIRGSCKFRAKAPESLVSHCGFRFERLTMGGRRPLQTDFALDRKLAFWCGAVLVLFLGVLFSFRLTAPPEDPWPSRGFSMEEKVYPCEPAHRALVVDGRLNEWAGSLCLGRTARIRHYRGAGFQVGGLARGCCGGPPPRLAQPTKAGCATVGLAQPCSRLSPAPPHGRTSRPCHTPAAPRPRAAELHRPSPRPPPRAQCVMA